MTYPSAPWRLCGQAIVQTRLMPLADARALIPPQLSPVPVLPGLTVAVLMLGAYATGSSLRYHELIVAPALVRHGLRIGGWISHIYVDHPDSVAGGREIWGLPKELAEFDWGADTIRVRQNEGLLCALSGRAPASAIRAPLLAPAFGQHDGQVLGFRGYGSARIGRGRAELQVPADSPFAWFEAGVRRAYYLQDLDIRVAAPGKKKVLRAVAGK